MKDSLDWMREELGSLADKAQLRSLVPAMPTDDGWLVRDGRRMLNLASNHYLGLPQRLDEERLARLSAAAEQLGGQLRVGSTASRLIVGSDPVFTQFEQELAAFKGTESALLFGSGYLANVGIIASLIGRHDLVYSDRLNHASIVDGIVLSRAELVRYRHRDLDQLEAQLRKAPAGRRKLIVTDTVFSMDGSLAPLRELVRLKERYGAMLMVDEAHSGGIYGERGQGLTHAHGLNEAVDVQMGTFSKAYGGYGAYFAGPAVVRDYLVNTARSLIYTTALPPVVVHAVRDNWLTAQTEGWRRQELLRKAAMFREQLQSAGFDTGASECQIVPVLVGGNAEAVAFGQALQEAGIAAVAIRPPTVPEGTARIRFTLMATHRDEDLTWAAGVMAEVGRSLGVAQEKG